MKQRTPLPVPGAAPSKANDLIAVVAGLALYALFVLWLHQRLIGVASPRIINSSNTPRGHDRERISVARTATHYRKTLRPSHAKYHRLVITQGTELFDLGIGT